MLKEGIFLGKRYEILERIGSGGMADVYKGKDHKLNRFVAVKVLKSDYRSDKVFIQKFLSEAQAAAGLMHPNVVNVYDVGQDRGLYYMVMELVEGITLKDYIEKKGRLSAKETISIAIQMVTGIQAAHNQHIIHRDIKPQNIIISNDGKVKVTDFGIARATTSTSTISTNVMGSVHYTSPEQARGGIVDEKSDIYSAGITIYEMVTGHVPYDGDSTVTVALKHLQDDFPRPSDEVKNIPRSLENIILKCVQKSTARRYQNCQELITDLKRAMVNIDADASKAGRKPAGATATVVMSEEEIDRLQKRRRRRERPEEEEYNNRKSHDDEDEGYDIGDDYNGNGRRNDRKSGDRKDDTSQDTRKVMKILMIVAAVIIAFAVLFMVGKAFGLFKSVPSITQENETGQAIVPNLLGMTEEQAQEALNRRGLGYVVVGREPSDHYKKGQIMEQKTKADTKVDKNTEIQVIVSTGEEIKNVIVPDVVGESEERAQKLLADKELVVEAESQYDSNIEAGKVISTDPPAGTEVQEGTTVKMIVSLGAEKVKIPNIVGMTAAQAEAELAALGLIGQATEEYSDKEAGTVISQKKKSGNKVDTGTVIEYTVSKGPEIQMVAVPTLTNKSREAAEQALTALGFSIGAVTEEHNSYVTPGKVISQSVAPGTEMPAGTAIDFVVSLGPDMGDEKNPDSGGDSGTNIPEE